jgi:hypothetical protein
VIAKHFNITVLATRLNYYTQLNYKPFYHDSHAYSNGIKEDITIYHYTEVGSGTQKFIYSTLDYMILLGLSSFFLGSSKYSRVGLELSK